MIFYIERLITKLIIENTTGMPHLKIIGNKPLTEARHESVCWQRGIAFNISILDAIMT
jgi:hypothetical protein